MKKLLIISLVFLINNHLVSAQTEEWNFLDETEYSIKYPQSWMLNKSGQMGITFSLLNIEASKSDLFNENINLIIQDLAGYNIDLNEYVEISENQIKTLVTDGEIISNQRLKKDGKEYHVLIYSGRQGTLNLRFEQRFWIQNNKAYVLTLTSEVAFFENTKEIEGVLDSFRVK